MEVRSAVLQQQLVELGYNYTIVPESVLLVEKLVGDLIETTENLQRYMRIAHQAIEEIETLKFGAEPYKCDNAKLTQECSNLHQSLINLKQSHAKELHHLQKERDSLHQQNTDLIASNKEHKAKITQLEINSIRKTSRNCEKSIHDSKKQASSSAPLLKENTTTTLMEQKVKNLTKEICCLKKQQLELGAINDDLKGKLCHREKEIHRLTDIIGNPKSIDSLNKNCCYQDVQMELLNKQEEITFLQKCNCDLEARLKDARNKQHEAMKHALYLAEKNTQLEKEMRDIDSMALTVEQECNDTKKSSDAKVKKLQERLQMTTVELQEAEKELQAIKIEKDRIKGDFDAVNIEKRQLQSMIEQTMEDRKEIAEKLNKYSIIENDLNQEIDRLVQQAAEQTRIIADLKGKLMMQGSIIENLSAGGFEQQKAHTARTKSPPTKSSKQKENEKPTKDKSPSPTRRKQKSSRSCKLPNVPVNTPASVNNENVQTLNKGDSVEPRGKSYECDYVGRIKSERDFYVREYKALLEKIRKDNMAERLNYNISISNTNEGGSAGMRAGGSGGTLSARDEMDCANSTSNTRALKVLQDQITQLQVENQSLAMEKHNLLSRLNDVRDHSDATEYLTLKATSKRLERERDILKADVERLEEERESMKNRMKVSSELHSSEIERYKTLVTETEEQLRNLEKERYDIFHNHATNRATITSLEDQFDSVKEQLKSSNKELLHQKTIYSQLKTLHEQTDRALADSQNQLMFLESKLSNSQERTSEIGNQTTILNKDICRLKESIELLTKNLNDVEREKDNLLQQLDEKTEKIASLEEEARKKNHEIDEFRQESTELRHKFSASIDERNSRESQIQYQSTNITKLQRDLDAALHAKAAVIKENKRIQDDLTAAIASNQKLTTELGVANRQIMDMKMQLQHYCAEVKRIEDMVTQKELERSEMLDQFKNLSEEASVLENSKYCLQTEASNSRLQLSVALDHADELEQIITQQKTLLCNYEKQISDLTSQLATFEMQMKHYQLQQDRTTLELTSLRELVSKLEKQKETVSKQLNERESVLLKANMELDTVKRNSDQASRILQKEQSATKALEDLLADTRQQLVEQQLINEELQNEVVKLKSQANEMDKQLNGKEKPRGCGCDNDSTTISDELSEESEYSEAVNEDESDAQSVHDILPATTPINEWGNQSRNDRGMGGFGNDRGMGSMENNRGMGSMGNDRCMRGMVGKNNRGIACVNENVEITMVPDKPRRQSNKCHVGIPTKTAIVRAQLTRKRVSSSCQTNKRDYDNCNDNCK